MNTRPKILGLTALIEVVTGVALLIAPAIVARLLLGVPLDATGVVLGRCFGIALLALGMAAWPRNGVAAAGPAMLAYNALIALYLAYLGTARGLRGPLLWAAVGLHAAVAIALAVSRGRAPGTSTR